MDRKEYMIRGYKSQDFEAMHRVLTESGLLDPGIDTRAKFDEKTRRDPESILVAFRENTLIGTVFFIEDGWNALIFHLAVKKECRKRGVGSLLMAEAEKTLLSRGATHIGLFVDDIDDDLRDYYQKRGYTEGSGPYRLMHKIIRRT